MKAYFIRHTKPQIEAGICYGQTDIAVCPLVFEPQYKALSEILPKKISKVFSSPLQRCQILAQKFTEKPIVDANLMELDFGDWEMQAWKDIELIQMESWMQDFVKNAPPKGESYEALSKRVQIFLQELSGVEGNILVVTHAGVMRAVFAWLLGLPLGNSFRLRLSYASCMIVDLDKDIQALHSSLVGINNFEDFF